MANLLVEYYNRHNTSCVLPSSEGVCFYAFDSGNPYQNSKLIALTSNMPKSYSKCLKCEDSAITVELFMPSSSGSGFLMINHSHIRNPDINLTDYIISCGYKVKPVYLKDEADIERWLWTFFGHVVGHVGNFEQARIAMTHCACTNPKMFKTYYKTYLTFFAGRKYLLLG